MADTHYLVAVMNPKGGNKIEYITLDELNTLLTQAEEDDISDLKAQVAALEAVKPTEKEVHVATAGTLDVTIEAVGADGKTFQVGTKTYTFRTALTTDPATIPNEILIAGNVSDQALYLKKAINGETPAGAYSAGTVANADVEASVDSAKLTLTMRVKGQAGVNVTCNDAAISDLEANVPTPLAGAVAGTVAEKGAILFDGTKLYVATEKLTAYDSTGLKEITYTT